MNFTSIYSFEKLWENVYSNVNRGVTFSNDGSKLFLFLDYTLHVVNANDGNTERIIPLPDSSIRYSFSPDESKILCRVKDTIIFINALDGSRINSFLPSFKSNEYSFVAISESNNSFYDGGSSLTKMDWEKQTYSGYSKLYLRSITDGRILKKIIDSNESYGIIRCFATRKSDEYFFSSIKWLNDTSLVTNRFYSFNENTIDPYYADTAINYVFPNYQYIDFYIKDFGEILTKYRTNMLAGDYNIITKDGLILYIYFDSNSSYGDFESYEYDNRWYMLFIMKNRIVLTNRTTYMPPHYTAIQESDTGNYKNIITSPHNIGFVSVTTDNVVTMWKASKIVGVKTETEDILTISPNPATDFIEISVGVNGRSPLLCENRIFNVFGQIVTTPNSTPALPPRKRRVCKGSGSYVLSVNGI